MIFAYFKLYIVLSKEYWCKLLSPFITCDGLVQTQKQIQIWWNPFWYKIQGSRFYNE